MGIGGRSPSSGRVAFVRLNHPGMGESEMELEAREHWESALVLASSEFFIHILCVCVCVH